MDLHLLLFFLPVLCFLGSDSLPVAQQPQEPTAQSIKSGSRLDDIPAATVLLNKDSEQEEIPEQKASTARLDEAAPRQNLESNAPKALEKEPARELANPFNPFMALWTWPFIKFDEKQNSSSGLYNNFLLKIVNIFSSSYESRQNSNGTISRTIRIKNDQTIQGTALIGPENKTVDTTSNTTKVTTEKYKSLELGDIQSPKEHNDTLEKTTRMSNTSSSATLERNETVHSGDTLSEDHNPAERNPPKKIETAFESSSSSPLSKYDNAKTPEPTSSVTDSVGSGKALAQSKDYKLTATETVLISTDSTTEKGTDSIVVVESSQATDYQQDKSTLVTKQADKSGQSSASSKNPEPLTKEIVTEIPSEGADKTPKETDFQEERNTTVTTKLQKSTSSTTLAGPVDIITTTDSFAEGISDTVKQTSKDTLYQEDENKFVTALPEEPGSTPSDSLTVNRVPSTEKTLTDTTSERAKQLSDVTNIPDEINTFSKTDIEETVSESSMNGALQEQTVLESTTKWAKQAPQETEQPEEINTHATQQFEESGSATTALTPNISPEEKTVIKNIPDRVEQTASAKEMNTLATTQLLDSGRATTSSRPVKTSAEDETATGSPQETEYQEGQSTLAKTITEELGSTSTESVLINIATSTEDAMAGRAEQSSPEPNYPEEVSTLESFSTQTEDSGSSSTVPHLKNEASFTQNIMAESTADWAKGTTQETLHEENIHSVATTVFEESGSTSNPAELTSPISIKVENSKNVQPVSSEMDHQEKENSLTTPSEELTSLTTDSLPLNETPPTGKTFTESTSERVEPEKTDYQTEDNTFVTAQAEESNTVSTDSPSANYQTEVNTFTTTKPEELVAVTIDNILPVNKSFSNEESTSERAESQKTNYQTKDNTFVTAHDVDSGSTNVSPVSIDMASRSVKSTTATGILTSSVEDDLVKENVMPTTQSSESATGKIAMAITDVETSKSENLPFNLPIAGTSPQEETRIPTTASPSSEDAQYQNKIVKDPLSPPGGEEVQTVHGPLKPFNATSSKAGLSYLESLDDLSETVDEYDSGEVAMYPDFLEKNVDKEKSS